MKKVEKSVRHVVSKNHCMSCGACQMTCKREAVRLEYKSKSGFYYPVIDSSKCIDCGACVKVCPALNTNLSSSHSFIGDNLDISLAHATDSNIRNQATSGGVVTTLVRWLLQENIVDAAVMVHRDQGSPIESSAGLFTSEMIEQLVTNTRDYSSRYVSVPVLCNVSDYLKQYKRIAVVGTPCQLQALSRIPSSRILKIGIACSGGMSYLATTALKSYAKMPDARVYYRGNGWPGQNTLISDNKVINSDHINSVFDMMFTSQIFKNHGCNYCRDHFAEFADISFCDFWNPEEMQNEKNGNSCVIIRNEEILKYYQQLQQDGYIEEIKKLEANEVIKSQANVLKIKKGNLRNTVRYKCYKMFVNSIFVSRIWHFFTKSIYRKLCQIYLSICQKEKLKI